MKEHAYTYPHLTPASPTSTISYSYNTTGWKDQLTGYNGQAITYDEIGNPLSYRGKALTWENGRQLAGVNSNISYTYTLDGTRLAKQVGSTKTEYTLDGNLVIRQKTGNEILNFYYDSAGKLLEIGYKANASAAETYYFVTRNSQGDIVELYKSSDSTKVGSYSYDSWGKLLGATYATGVDVSSVYDILNKNPFRYRGYYYDTETGWYYLQSRYYDPEVKRFVNADWQFNPEDGATGFNLYAYCNNDPVNQHDPSGHEPITAVLGLLLLLAAAAATAAGGVALGTAYQGVNGIPIHIPSLPNTTAHDAPPVITPDGYIYRSPGVVMKPDSNVTQMPGAIMNPTDLIIQAENKAKVPSLGGNMSDKDANRVAKENGFDGAEELKDDYAEGHGSEFDMKVEKKTGRIWLENKNNKTRIETDFYRK